MLLFFIYYFFFFFFCMLESLGTTIVLYERNIKNFIICGMIFISVNVFHKVIILFYFFYSIIWKLVL